MVGEQQQSRKSNWKTGIWKERFYICIPPENPFSGKVPAKLMDGDQATFVWEMDKFEGNFGRYGKKAPSGRVRESSVVHKGRSKHFESA